MRGEPRDPAPLPCRKPADSAPQILATPAWIHITPSQTRRAAQAGAASFEDLSLSHGEVDALSGFAD